MVQNLTRDVIFLKERLEKSENTPFEHNSINTCSEMYPFRAYCYILDQRFLVGPVDTTCKDHMVSQGKSLVYKRYTYTHISITGVAIF